MRGKILPYLLICAFGLLVIEFYLYHEWRLTAGFEGVTLDDSWIHYRFASNLRNGNGFSFNPGVPTPGSTSPLWVLVLSIVDMGYLIPSKILGILAYLGTGFVVYELGRHLDLKRSYAILAGISTLAAGRFAWAAPSGMETTTFALVSLFALWSWSRDAGRGISPGTSLAFGLACLLRPEGYLLLALSGPAWLICNDDSQGWTSRLANLTRHYLIAGAAILPYFAFSWLATGHWLPNTFYAKSATWGCQTSPAYFLWIGAVFLLDNPIFTLLAGFGLAAALKSGRWKARPWYILAGAWMVSLPIVYGFLAPCISGYYTRYTTALIPVVMLFGASGGKNLEARIAGWFSRPGNKIASPNGKSRLPLALMAEGILLALLPTTLFWAPFYAQSAADIEIMHVRIGRWLSANTAPADVLALNDIGAIGYLADREVLDLGGLVSPEVLPLIEGKGPGTWDQPLANLLAQKRPEYLVIFPNWYPDLVESLPATPVYQVQLKPRTIAGIANITVVGGGEMRVYRLDWDESGGP